MSQIINNVTKVYIDSVDVTDYVIQWTISVPKTGIRTSNIEINKDATDLLNNQKIVGGEIVEIYDGPDYNTLTRKFYGNIVRFRENITNISIDSNDELYKLTGDTFVKVYDINDPNDDFAGDLNAILVDMITEGGLVIDYANIDTTGVILPQVVCDNVVFYDKIIELLKIPNFRIFQDPVTREILIKNPSLYSTYATTFTISDNIVTLPEYDTVIYQIINEVEVQGLRASASNTETFTAAAAQTVYTLGKKPIDTYVKCTVAGTERIGSVEGSQTANPDFIINTNLGTLTFINNIPTVGQSVVVNYTSKELTSVTANDEDSIAQYGKRRLLLDLPDTTTLNDALNRAQAIIEESKDGFMAFKIDVINADDLLIYNKVNATDIVKGKTFNNYELQSITFSWPSISSSITIGKSMFNYENLIMSMEERIKKLERLRQEGILLNVSKINDIKYYIFIDDVEIWKDDILVPFKHFELDTDSLDDPMAPLGDYSLKSGTVGESE